MCELFAVSSRFAVTVNLSLEAFSRHGGLSGPHKDGWGIAYYEAGDVRLIRDTTAASESPWVRFIEERKLHSHLVLSHIRRATIGGSSFETPSPLCVNWAGACMSSPTTGIYPALNPTRASGCAIAGRWARRTRNMPSVRCWGGCKISGWETDRHRRWLSGQ